MKKAIFLLSINFLLISCSIQKKSIEKLKIQLTEIHKSDQELRKLFTNHSTEEEKLEILIKYGISTEEFKKKGWKIVEEQDSLNLKEIESIIAKYGYPGKSLVGVELSHVAYLVIQHSSLNTIQKYFNEIEKASLSNELNPYYFAFLQDRKLMYEGKEQVYGTQIAGRYKFNDEKNKYEWVSFVWPIKDPNKVNEYRKNHNFKSTIEEYSNSMNITNPFEYRIEDVEKMKTQID